MPSSDEVIYELRTYHAYPEKLEELLARFRNHTLKIFEKHGMKNVAYWTAADQPQLIYVLEHRSREAARQSWADMSADPEWVAIKAATEAKGKLFSKIDSTYMTKTNFSPSFS